MDEARVVKEGVAEGVGAEDALGGAAQAGALDKAVDGLTLRRRPLCIGAALR